MRTVYTRSYYNVDVTLGHVVKQETSPLSERGMDFERAPGLVLIILLSKKRFQLICSTEQVSCRTFWYVDNVIIIWIFILSETQTCVFLNA